VLLLNIHEPHIFWAGFGLNDSKDSFLNNNSCGFGLVLVLHP
jgi:hypothetical protein